MNHIKIARFLLISTLLSSLSEAALLYHRDTLNILSRFGREVSVSEQGRFVVDSIIPGEASYPCSVKHSGIFFASLGMFPVCPCCPSWTIGAPRAFYTAKRNHNINWSIPLELNNTLFFSKLDTNKTTETCYLPKTGDNQFLVFTHLASNNKINYLLVHVIRAYVDPSKPTMQGGGALDYPLTTCDNMLVVEMWLQTDGTTNFKDAGLTSTFSKPKILMSNQAILSRNDNCKWYTLQGNVVTDLKPQKMPQGCYLIKNGSLLKKQVFMYHY